MLNEEPHTIVGVMPPGFEYPMWNVVPDAYIPISRKYYCCSRLGVQDAVARLKPGVALERARSQLESLAAGVAVEHPDTNRGRSAGLVPLAQAMTCLAPENFASAASSAVTSGPLMNWQWASTRDTASSMDLPSLCRCATMSMKGMGWERTC